MTRAPASLPASVRGSEKLFLCSTGVSSFHREFRAQQAPDPSLMHKARRGRESGRPDRLSKNRISFRIRVPSFRANSARFSHLPGLALMAAALLSKLLKMNDLEVKKPFFPEVKKEKRPRARTVFQAPAGAEEEA